MSSFILEKSLFNFMKSLTFTNSGDFTLNMFTHLTLRVLSPTYVALGKSVPQC